MPRFRLLPKVNSFKLSRKRCRPGEEVELTQEQGNRFNMDLFELVYPCATAKEPEPTLRLLQLFQLLQLQLRSPRNRSMQVR